MCETTDMIWAALRGDQIDPMPWVPEDIDMSYLDADFQITSPTSFDNRKWQDLMMGEFPASDPKRKIFLYTRINGVESYLFGCEHMGTLMGGECECLSPSLPK